MIYLQLFSKRNFVFFSSSCSSSFCYMTKYIYFDYFSHLKFKLFKKKKGIEGEFIFYICRYNRHIYDSLYITYDLL